MKTNTQIKIDELTIIVNNAHTHTINGRQEVSNACKQLYNIIEEDIYAVDKVWMLKGMYNDLCNGNFAEPYMCELKKDIFKAVVEIYNTRVLPYL